MLFSTDISQRIATVAYQYLGRPYDFKTFDCVHFVIDVYRDVGITIPVFGGKGFPPRDFHLSVDEFTRMPLGRIAFFKRKLNTNGRIWTHAAIIVSPYELIHCSKHFGGVVTVTEKTEFMEIYALAPNEDSDISRNPA